MKQKCVYCAQICIQECGCCLDCKDKCNFQCGLYLKEMSKKDKSKKEGGDNNDK